MLRPVPVCLMSSLTCRLDWQRTACASIAAAVEGALTCLAVRAGKSTLFDTRMSFTWCMSCKGQVDHTAAAAKAPSVCLQQLQSHRDARSGATFASQLSRLLQEPTVLLPPARFISYA